jgi:hypothetical protein
MYTLIGGHSPFLGPTLGPSRAGRHGPSLNIHEHPLVYILTSVSGIGAPGVPLTAQPSMWLYCRLLEPA